MPRLVPPHLQSAFEQLQQAYQAAHGAPLDLLKTSWSETEKGVIKLFGGPFHAERPEHQMIALGLSYMLGERLIALGGGFWFPNRDVPEGTMVGFEEALITLAPFGAVLDALMQAKLPKLDELAQEIHRGVAAAKFSLAGGAGPKLTEGDYAAMFDPGFVQFISLDSAKLKETFAKSPDRLAMDLRQGIARSDPELPESARKQVEAQIVGALRGLSGDAGLATRIPSAPRITELCAHLFATEAATGAGPAEFWAEVVLPLLFVGEPAQFPPIDPEDLEALSQGADPLALLLEVVPYATPAPEDGLLGAFPAESVGLLDPAFEKVPSPRMLTVDPSALRPLLEKFDPGRTRDVIRRFTDYAQENLGKPIAPSGAEEQMADAAIRLLEDLKKAIVDAPSGRIFCLRRVTEAEALSESALAIVRKYLSGPRIILA